jgi:hypothetical protein
MDPSPFPLEFPEIVWAKPEYTPRRAGLQRLNAIAFFVEKSRERYVKRILLAWGEV